MQQQQQHQQPQHQQQHFFQQHQQSPPVTWQQQQNVHAPHFAHGFAQGHPTSAHAFNTPMSTAFGPGWARVKGAA